MLKENRNLNSSFTWQKKHLFLLSREVEAWRGGGCGGVGGVEGEVEYRIPAYFYENPASRTFVVDIFQISFFLDFFFNSKLPSYN